MGQDSDTSALVTRYSYQLAIKRITGNADNNIRCVKRSKAIIRSIDDMDIKTAALRTIAVSILIVVIAGSANAGAPSWSAFKPADFSDIFITQSLAKDVLTYTLSVGPNPTVSFSGHTYDVNWVQAYYVVSQDSETPFNATEGTTPTDWDWQAKGKDIVVAGWSGQGNSRIYPNESKTLQFGSFDISENAVLSGMHVGYQAGNCDNSGWFKGSLEAVPEPSALICLAVGLTGIVSVVSRRGRQ
jgi:hypothetical protein